MFVVLKKRDNKTLKKKKKIVRPRHNALEFMFDRPALKTIKYSKNIFP
jgi:hypothetical protein